MKRSTESLTLADSPLLPSSDLTVLIPARAGSKRVPGKNLRVLGGKPLLQWTIDAAKAADVARIIVSSDDPRAHDLARANGVDVHVRIPAHASDTAPDYWWVQAVTATMVTSPIVAILRPTSPFRTASTIRRAYALLKGSPGAHSVRAVRPATEHPGKMWRDAGTFMEPAIDGRHPEGTPWHSSPTQTLPTYYVQTASLEMAWVWAIQQTRTISGVSVVPFLSDELERFDINTLEDWARAEALAAGF